MKRTCENCNKPIFETDTICWHCGHKQTEVTRPGTAIALEETNLVTEDERDPESEPVPNSLILFYGALTALIAIALLLTMRSLGQSPTVTFNPSSSPGEWVTIFSPDKSFTVDIPATWEWQFLDKPGAELASTDLLENERQIVTAVNPLGNLVPDIEYILVAQKDEKLLVVARSERLSRLTPQQAVTSLQSEQFDNLTVKDAQLIQGESGAGKALFTLEHANVPFRCDQLLVPASSETYVVAACTATEKYDQQSGELRTTLNSFTTQFR